MCNPEKKCIWHIEHSIIKRLHMRKFLCVLLFTPLFMEAQQLRIKQPYLSQSNIKKIRERNGKLTIVPARTKWLSIGGNYTFSAAAISANTLPSLQQQYGQGPDTNGIFSYGPPIKGVPYNNSIFRTGSRISQSLTLQASIRHSSWDPLWAFSLKAGSSNDATIIQDNRNTSHNISLSATRYLKQFSIGASYSYFSSRFSNDNSNGFLNRVYQNALLTPSSFSNAQSTTLPTGGQRAYSNQADNPWFLLKDNGHFADRVQQTGSLVLEQKLRDVTFGVITALDAVNDNSNQSLKASTVSFPTGLLYTRKQTDDHFSSNAYMTYKVYSDGNSFSARLNYIYNDEKVEIYYPADVYSYHRRSSDASLTFNSTYDGYNFNAGLNAGNKLYISNTSTQNKFLLPEVSGYIASNRFPTEHFNVKLAANYTSFCSEPPINHSLSAYMLTQRTPKDVSLFIPFTEVNTYNDLAPMQHREFVSWLQLDYERIISLRADFSIRDTKDNVFPIYNNNQLSLKNLADTRYKSFELALQINTAYRYPPKLSVSNKVSFFKFSNTVTRIQDGYDNYRIAGFSTVYKALVKGRPVGVIMGNSYNLPSVIGNPTPDYTVKFSHVATWKAFTFNLDWEYRKGGDVWNGTAAVLDYYGRSAASAVDRNSTSQDRWVRYGYTGVAASYIQKGDNIRIHNLSLAYDIKTKKYLQRIRLTAYAENLLLWSAYKGVDPNQLLYDQPGSGGLDFFNLPSTKTYGVSASFQL